MIDNDLCHRYINQLETGQTQYIQQINDLKEVSAIYVMTHFSILNMCCGTQFTREFLENLA